MGRIIISIICGAVAFVVAFNLVSNNSGPSRKALKDMPVAEILGNLAKAAKSRQGKKVAWNVIVVDAVVEEGRRLTYNYKISNAKNGRYDEEKADKIFVQLQKKACRDRIMRRAMKGGAEINYAYTDKNGEDMFSIKVNESVCYGFS